MKKNYFKILNVPQKLLLDHNELKKNYFNILKEHSNDPILDPTGKKKDNKNKKVLIELAYQTLKDRITRIKHLLEIQGIMPANDNKAPRHFAPLAEQICQFLDKAKTDKSYICKLKELHTDVLTEFSTISIELANLEKAWDSGSKDGQELLKKLKRKSAAFNYIRSIEQDIRDTIA